MDREGGGVLTRLFLIMCMCLQYPLRYLGILMTLIGLAVLVVVVYVVGGCVGTYKELVWDVENTANVTTALEQATQILSIVYSTHQAPEVFNRWGTIFSIAYVITIVTITIVRCALTACECGTELTKTCGGGGGGERRSDYDGPLSSSNMLEMEEQRKSLRNQYNPSMNKTIL